MEVIKRNGEKEEISFDKIKNRLNQMAAKKPVLNIPATLKFSCFGKLPKGVDTNTDDIKFNVSPI